MAILEIFLVKFGNYGKNRGLTVIPKICFKSEEISNFTGSVNYLDNYCLRCNIFRSIYLFIQ